MYSRFLERPLLDALSDTPVVLIIGARQTGKTTLAQQIASGPHPAQFVSLDDGAQLYAATHNPAGFLAQFSGPVIIDEIQHAPELFPAIKLSVDRNRRPGRFLLTGSANVLVLPRLSETLAGRMEILTLWPLCQAEVEGSKPHLIDRLFADDFTVNMLGMSSRENIVDRIFAGGFPELVERAEDRRLAWFGSYVTTIIQRDIREIVNVQGATEMPNLLAFLASRLASQINIADASRITAIPYTTLNRYLALFHATFLIHVLPSWSSSIRGRLTRLPKLLISDTGLAAYLAQIDKTALFADGPLFGSCLENFVAMELVKMAEVSAVKPSMSHYRTKRGVEVDIVMEGRNGRTVGVEVKASSTIDVRDLRWLREFAQAAGDRFHRGVIFYTGEHALQVSDRIWALPIQALWSS